MEIHPYEVEGQVGIIPSTVKALIRMNSGF